MTYPYPENSPSGAEMITIELDPNEAMVGASKTVPLPRGGWINVSVPPGVVHGMVLRLAPSVGTDPTDPSTPPEVYLQVLIKPVAGATTTLGVPPSPPVRPSRRRRWWAIGIAATVVLLLVGAAGAFALARRVDRVAKVGEVVGPVASPSPTLRTLTMSEYRALLVEIDTAMAAAMKAVVAARNVTTVAKTSQALADTSGASLDKLNAVAAPPGAESVHRRLTRGLYDLRTLAGIAALDAQSRNACTGSAAVTTIGNATTMVPFRATLREANTIDPTNPLTLGGWLPAPRAEQNRSLANGTYVKKGTRNGANQMKIDNRGGLSDVSLSLVPVGAKTTAFAVYVKKNATFTVTRIPSKTYDVYLTAGVDWDPAALGFSRDCDFTKFNDPLEFTSNSQTYTIWTLTLKPSGVGNAPSEDIDPDLFPQ